jgi:hypothetical protein
VQVNICILVKKFKTFWNKNTLLKCVCLVEKLFFMFWKSVYFTKIVGTAAQSLDVWVWLIGSNCNRMWRNHHDSLSGNQDHRAHIGYLMAYSSQIEVVWIFLNSWISIVTGTQISEYHFTDRFWAFLLLVPSSLSLLWSSCKLFNCTSDLRWYVNKMNQFIS